MQKENLFSFDVVSRVSFLVNAATLVTCSYQLHNTVTTLCHIADQLGLPIMFTLHIHTFNSPLSRITRVSQYQKGKTNPDFTEARDTELQWHQLGHMQVCTLLQTDNHASTLPLSFFYRPDALSVTQPTASKH